jgi:sec-independent protein translocase protein TatA
MIGTWQIVLIVFVIILLFGAKRIPDLAGSIGKGLKEFKKATSDDPKELADSSKEDSEEKKS